MPATKNVDRLDGRFVVWEEAMDAARGSGPGDGLVLGAAREREVLWRRGVRSMPTLDVEALRVSLPLLRRAHVVLAFLAHFYAHTTPSDLAVEIPESLAVPLLAVSDLVGLPPILTYADTVLWNFQSPQPSAALSLSANPPTYTLASFTNTRSEQQFYIISALCEIAGSEALRLMRRSLDELFLADQTALKRLTTYLKKLAVQIDRIGDITLSIMKEVDPEEFYHLIRPWFKGGDANGPDSLGWIFMGTEDQAPAHAAENANRGQRKGRMFSGPSAGQSSLIHAIDIFLTVDHSPNEEDDSVERTAAPALHLNHAPVAAGSASEEGPATTPARPAHPINNEASFVQRMLQYMPLQHRTFLLHLTTHPTPLRPLVIAHAQSHPHLAAAYDSALEALKRFREKHMRVVSLFIVQQARRQPSPRIRKLLGQEVNEDAEGVEGELEELNGELRGTGGTPLFKFLKRCRDNTTRAMIGQSAGPTYDLE